MEKVHLINIVYCFTYFYMYIKVICMPEMLWVSGLKAERFPHTSHIKVQAIYIN